MLGFDLDNTITENWFTKNKWGHEDTLIACKDKTKLECLKFILINAEISIIPITYVHIITCRPLILFDITYDFLIKHKVKFLDIHMSDRFIVDTEEAAKFKSEIINDLSLVKYVEDDEQIRGRLINLCPDTIILTPHEAVNCGLAKRNVKRECIDL